MSKKIIMTGGGTAGHVTPNIALMPALKSKGYEIMYIGSKTGIEKQLITEQGVKYFEISTGKLRRYFDLKNFTDPFRVIKGFFEAASIIKKEKPDIIFSKGGFVSVPVVIAGKKNKVPVIIHESDMTPGLANKLSFSSATYVCCNFPETVTHLPDKKGIYTGSPIREELFTGNREKALEFLKAEDDKPFILVMGGSLGAVAVNKAVREILDGLLLKYNIIHLCGQGKVDESLSDREGYYQFEFIKDELRDLFALSDIIISRAGANAICEIKALAKPNILIPLSAAASRGDQILNARSFEKQGFSVVFEEEELTAEKLFKAVNDLCADKDKYIGAMKKDNENDAIETIVDLIEKTSK